MLKCHSAAWFFFNFICLFFFVMALAAAQNFDILAAICLKAYALQNFFAEK
jgi:hypothetical protein